MKRLNLSRRSFIQKSSLTAAAIGAGGIVATSCGEKKQNLAEGGIPRRPFGNTGREISILGYGGGSQFMKMPDGEWEPHLEHALKSGINYFDTASTYGTDTDKPSQERFGEILPSHRDNIILLTKIHDRDPDKARKEFETSLKQLRTDYVDVLLIHAITPEDQLADIEKGVYKLVQEFKNEKMVKHIGFSSMDSAERSAELIDNLDFDVTLLAMNPTNYGNFAEIALPSARKKNLGTIAMKVMRDIVNKHASPKELLEFAWNLEGVNCALVSQTGMEPLYENIALAEEYGKSKITATDSEALENRLAYLAHPGHLVYSNPGYYDGMVC